MPINNKKTAQRLYLEEVKGSILDHFLDNGWYRMGPTIFTCHYIYFNSTLLSTIWLRTTLKDHVLSKSLKKLNRKNKAQLTHTFQPYQYSVALDELFQKYKQGFKGKLPESLDKYMMDSLSSDIYDTYLVKVYKDETLIACSIFDIGEKTLASIFGFYDPSYRTMSLGLYTMLLEIEFAHQHNMSLYYIGYFVPGNPRFDYKLRIGNIEYLDFKTKQWFAFDQFDYEETPIKVIRKKLDILKSVLDKKYDIEIYQNPFIDAYTVELLPAKYVEDPYILNIKGVPRFDIDENILICTYDVRLDLYKLYHCQIFKSFLSFYHSIWFESFDDTNYKNQLVVKKTLKSCKTISPIEQWIKSACSL